MPWHIEQMEDEWCVVEGRSEEDAGDVVACHETEEEAQAQLRALYASEPDAAGKHKMKTKTLKAEVKVWGDEGAGEFSAYASTFANWDDQGERPAKGAFAPHLDAFLKDGFIAFGHDWQALPIATPVEAYEDDQGLFLRAAFHSTPQAQAARTVVSERLERGKSVKTSIGYEVLKDTYTSQGRLLDEVKLYEVSLVTVPANPLADVLAAKGAGSALGFVEHSEAVVSAVDEYVRRAKDRAAFRAKEGRVLSAANRKRIASLLESLEAVRGDLDDLLRATEPKADPDTAKRLLLEYLHTQALLNGVLP